MRIIFAGTPEFAATALRGLQQHGLDIALVLTQPDRPAGRGMKPLASPVKQLAQHFAIPVLQPVTLKDPQIQAQLAAVNADIMVVVAYGLILPQAVLQIPALGAINIHASLLPRWRGAAPIQRAILAGDSESGICIMQMEAGLDTGPILLSQAVAITADDTAGSLHNRLATLGSEMIVELLGGLSKQKPTERAVALHIAARPQPDQGITYAAKILKSEAMIDWQAGNDAVLRQIRAFNPAPGAYAILQGEPVKLWLAQAAAQSPTSKFPATVLQCSDDGIEVATGDGSILLTQLQRPGGKRLNAAEFLRGKSIAPGMSFDRSQQSKTLVGAP
jgi:methionyl-tRNA formyltransferase